MPVARNPATGTSSKSFTIHFLLLEVSCERLKNVRFHPAALLLVQRGSSVERPPGLHTRIRGVLVDDGARLNTSRTVLQTCWCSNRTLFQVYPQFWTAWNPMCCVFIRV